MTLIQNSPAGRSLDIDHIIGLPKKWLALFAKDKRDSKTKSTEEVSTTDADAQRFTGADLFPLSRSKSRGLSRRIPKLLILVVALLCVIFVLMLFPMSPTGERRQVQPTKSVPIQYYQSSSGTPAQTINEASRKPGIAAAGWDESFFEQVTVHVVSALRRESGAAPE